MIEVILFVQSGENGPVRLVGCTKRSIKRTLTALQRGNPELVYLRMAISGDERTERRLHTEIDSVYRARDWYEPKALTMIPMTFRRHEYDQASERQRIASIKLDEILRQP